MIVLIYDVKISKRLFERVLQYTLKIEQNLYNHTFNILSSEFRTFAACL
jgi:hypothetical protein